MTVRSIGQPPLIYPNEIEFVGNAGVQYPMWISGSGVSMFRNPANNIWENRYKTQQLIWHSILTTSERKFFQLPQNRGFWYFENNDQPPMHIPSSFGFSPGNGGYITEFWKGGRTIGVWSRMLPLSQSDVDKTYIIRANSNIVDREDQGFYLCGQDTGSGGIDGTVRLRFSIDLGPPFIAETNTPVWRYGSTSEFQYVALGFDQDTKNFKIWIDGQSQAYTVISTGGSTYNINTETSISFGNAFGIHPNMTCQVAHYHIYSRILSDDDVMANYIQFAKHFKSQP